MITKKVLQDLDYKSTANDWIVDLYHDISRATYEVCFLDADSHIPLCIRALQTQWSQPYVNPCFSTSCAHSVGFTAEIHHVSCSSNKYSIEIDGLLASGRGSQTGRRACYFSAFHRLEKSHKAPDENSDSRQLVPLLYQNNVSRFDVFARPGACSNHRQKHSSRKELGAQFILNTSRQNVGQGWTLLTVAF